MKKVKITVLKTTLQKDLADEYGIENFTTCPMLDEGDVFYGDYAKPEGFCDDSMCLSVPAYFNGAWPSDDCFDCYTLYGNQNIVIIMFNHRMWKLFYYI